MKRPILMVSTALLIVLLVALAYLTFRFNGIHNLYSAISWKIEGYTTYLRSVSDPAGQMPTALPPPKIKHQPLPTQTDSAVGPNPTQTLVVALEPTQTPTATLTPMPTATLPPLPDRASLPPPAPEKQDANNCGPATLAMYLRFFNWTGNQADVANVIKPNPDDRNVNVDELIYYVRTHAGWINADYRVGGTLETLKRFLSNGMPIMIEESSHLSDSYWPGDDHWAGHYLLLTGYDDAARSFISQDSWLGPNLPVNYDMLNSNWQGFNRAYIFLYRPDQEDTVKAILGANWDEATSRTNALNTAKAETQAAPDNGFAWFNLGTNLLYFDRYNEAAVAYDTARKVGLPQRMLRYQFGPFITYFKTNRNTDLLALSEFALKITPNSEENLLWQGWALYRDGKPSLALEDFQKALQVNPTYQEAQYAIDFVSSN